MRRNLPRHGLAPYLGLLLVAAAMTTAVPARAIPPYPGDLQSALTLTYTPQCAICHEDGVTGLGTVVTPFGTSMRMHGLTDDPTTFPGALAEMEADNVDSVGRGFSDIEALKMDVNPNTVPANGMPTSPSPAAYGCNTRIAPGRTTDASAAWMFGAVALLWTASQRRRR